MPHTPTHATRSVRNSIATRASNLIGYAPHPEQVSSGRTLLPRLACSKYIHNHPRVRHVVVPELLSPSRMRAVALSAEPRRSRLAADCSKYALGPLCSRAAPRETNTCIQQMTNPVTQLRQSPAGVPRLEVGLMQRCSAICTVSRSPRPRGPRTGSPDATSWQAAFVWRWTNPVATHGRGRTTRSAGLETRIQRAIGPQSELSCRT